MAKIDMIGIVVKNMPRALAFYRALGLDIPAEMDTEEHVSITTLNGYRIAWDTEEVIKGFDPSWTAPSGNSHGRIGLAFLCDNPADVDATFKRLVGLGHRSHKEPWDAFWGQRYAQVLDPDGNAIDLFAPL